MSAGLAAAAGIIFMTAAVLAVSAALFANSVDEPNNGDDVIGVLVLYSGPHVVETCVGNANAGNREGNDVAGDVRTLATPA